MRDNAPRTAEGAAAWRICLRDSVWQISVGPAGLVVLGLNWPAVWSALGDVSNLNLPALREALLGLEAGRLKAESEKNSEGGEL